MEGQIQAVNGRRTDTSRKWKDSNKQRPSSIYGLCLSFNLRLVSVLPFTACVCPSIYSLCLSFHLRLVSVLFPFTAFVCPSSIYGLCPSFFPFCFFSFPLSFTACVSQMEKGQTQAVNGRRTDKRRKWKKDRHKP
jgi:hypothetical protein